jgi:hypothetical protein
MPEKWSVSLRFSRAKSAAYWLAPILFGLVLYWPGVTTWFQKDDFAWLGLRGMVHSFADLRWALFTPLAQGTLRILSERVFYLLFTSLFDLNALPFRLWSFATYSLDAVLITAVCAKLTRSPQAGFWAALLWTANGCLGVVMSWTAIYYELACAAVFLSALWLLIRYGETGRMPYLAAQWAVFLLGFGVLEQNVVYPALAAVYALCRAPRLLKSILPMFLFSAAYTLWHFQIAPPLPSGPYRMYWDASVFPTLWTYWKWALGPSRLNLLGIHPSFWRSLLTAALTIALAVFLARQLHRKLWIAGFFPAWFFIVLAPLLPLRDHVSDYYLTIPVIGLAMLGGWALAELPRTAIVLALLYIAVNVPVGRATALSFHRRAEEIQNLIDAVLETRSSNPGKIVILKGTTGDLFWSCLVHRPFRLYGITGVYSSASDRSLAGADPDALQLFLDEPTEKRLLDDGRAVVVQALTAARSSIN